jgi:hypothetical protein
MSSSAMNLVFWALFAGLLAAGGYLFLAACDLGVAPLFGLHYCKVEAKSRELENEKAHQRALLARLGEAQLRLALLPTCQPPPEKPPRKEEPPPKTVEERLGPSPADLVVPKRKEDLEGCWQSVRGDLEFVEDTPKHEPVGVARICYCFGKNGRGKVRQIYATGRMAGNMCETRLTAVLKPDELLFSHPEIPCAKGHQVASEAATIVCRSTRDAATSCTMTYDAKFPSPPSQEQFQRVSNEACRWRPGR